MRFAIAALLAAAVVLAGAAGADAEFAVTIQDGAASDEIQLAGEGARGGLRKGTKRRRSRELQASTSNICEAQGAFVAVCVFFYV
jgi:hypothetical protein